MLLHDLYGRPAKVSHPAVISEPLPEFRAHIFIRIRQRFYRRQRVQKPSVITLDRFDAGLLMMVCAVLALAGAFTSFGDRRGRVLTLLLSLLCLALSLTAAYLLYRMGRGISWSATVTALIAAAELVFLIPSLLPSARGAGLSPGGSVQKGKTGTKSAENPDKKKK